MQTYQSEISVKSSGQGLYECTEALRAALYDCRIDVGICSIFIKHTSASLLIQENADPSARYDLEQWISRYIPENDPEYTHVFEGADDMPAHIKSAITATSLSIPVTNGSLALGTWQGVYLWEHRRAPHTRKIVITIVGTNAT